MMSLKDIINKKIGVTHATVLVFIWVSLSIMEQFVLYEPIPLENIAFFTVVIFTVLKSKDQDQHTQQLLTTDNDGVGITTEFDSFMRTMKDTVSKYEKFFMSLSETVKSIPEEEKEQLTKDMREADSPEEAEAILKDAIPIDVGDWP